ncbi:MAG: hypothetical protein M3Z85_07305 [Acidobacteriota bacterium]|nr:hypothetical protein [Acidobacteriota bacterium]
MSRKFVIAMSCYAVMAIGAVFVLDGVVRNALWIFLGGLAVKTLIAYYARW